MISIISALPGRVTTSVMRRWPAAALQSFEQASNALWFASSHCSMSARTSPSPQKHTLPSSHRLMRQVRETPCSLGVRRAFVALFTVLEDAVAARAFAQPSLHASSVSASKDRCHLSPCVARQGATSCVAQRSPGEPREASGSAGTGTSESSRTPPEPLAVSSASSHRRPPRREGSSPGRTEPHASANHRPTNMMAGARGCILSPSVTTWSSCYISCHLGDLVGPRERLV